MEFTFWRAYGYGIAVVLGFLAAYFALGWINDVFGGRLGYLFNVIAFLGPPAVAAFFRQRLLKGAN